MINPMEFRQSESEGAENKFKDLTMNFKAMYEVILKNCPKSAERTLAIRSLQESRMWANASLVFEGVEYEK